MTDDQPASAAPCCNGTCGRKAPIRVLMSDLTGRAYALTRYTQRSRELIASEKHDVTMDVKHLLAEAWSRGWDDCVETKRGDTVANPYAPKERP